MKTNILSTMLLGAAVPVVTGEAAEFIPLSSPEGSTSATSLSADGSTVLGQVATSSGSQLFRWTADGGFTSVPLFNPGEGFSPNLSATSISGDGSIVIGYAFTGTRTEGVRWSPDAGFSLLGALPAAETGEQYSLGLDISADGNAAAASGTSPLTPFTTALYWNGTGGLIPLGFLPEDQPDEFSVSFSFAQAVSSDGQVVVGSSASTKHLERGDQAFRWNAIDGMTGLGFLPGENQSTATAVSADGSVVVGVSGLSAFRWTAENGLENIGNFFPTGVSADGNVVVGVAQADVAVATIWTSEAGAQALQSVLEAKLGAPLGWQSLSGVVALSDDGSKLAGNGLNADGVSQAFVADLSSDDIVVVSTGAISYWGAVNFLLEDPDGRNFGTDPITGEVLNEIPGLETSVENGTTTAGWSDILSGKHLVQLNGTCDSTYSLSFDFFHLDEQTSGADFSGRLLKGGVHIYGGTVSEESATGAVYKLIYAESDGDKVPDDKDAVLYSDMRPTIWVCRVNTGVCNKVLANGTTLNDVMNALDAKATSGTDLRFLAEKQAMEWERAGIFTKEERMKFQKAVTNNCR
ncbi:MAG TPA: hypothetical protein VF773_12230 [Verrucomicrobiae bacterium]